jgi:arsenate reductase (thioredoxin)
MMKEGNVLILCTGNSCRSQMAEGLLRELAGDRFHVYSAGTDPAERVHPLAIQAMADRGIDISRQRPKGINDYLGRLTVRHLIIVCQSANASCPLTFPGAVKRLFWPMEDPAEFVGSEADKLERFRDVRDQIEDRLRTWLKEAT